ncbi:MAG TPA: hypothetical protein VGH05_19715 [Buttiauxella sp.]|jgi:hypothetical protein
MNIQEIPLSADNQIFAIQLGDKQLRLRLIYRDEAGWILDVMAADATPTISGIPLVTDTNLLAPYTHLGFTETLLVVSDDREQLYPTKTNLGFQSHLYFVTDN